MAMLAAVAAATIVSAVKPHSVAVWVTEIFWSLGLLAILLLTRRSFRFSLAAYACFLVWMMLQTIGAHYTFELVPMDWLKVPLGLARNPYDRIAHFTVGWFAFPFAELFFRKGWVKSATLAAFFAVMTVVAMAGLWEIVEWQYAVIDGGDAGAAFLGSQGDVWDAQKDILCDTLGSICAAVLFLYGAKWREMFGRRKISLKVNRKVRFAFWAILSALVMWGGSVIAVNCSSAGRLFDKAQMDKIPHCRAAVVLGCCKILANGRLNLYFTRRISAAAELYKSGKVDCLVVSGDNHIKEYDEASDMKDSLVAAGVPAEHIVCDYAGFRTLDSVVRAKKVFGLDSFIVVSQKDHARRAVFTARGFGCDAFGYAAQEVKGPFSTKTRIREQFAKVAAVLDVILRRSPKFLGPREPLPE